MDAKEREKEEHEDELTELLSWPSDENVRHWINYAKGANHFFTNVRYGNVEELFEQVCNDYELHPALEAEFYNAQEAVSKAFDIQEMLKERFGFTKKHYFRDKQGLMNLIYGEAPKGYYSAKTHSFATLLNLPESEFKEKSIGCVISASLYTLEAIDDAHEAMQKGKDYIPDIEYLSIKYNAFKDYSKSTCALEYFFNVVEHQTVPEHELKHIIDGLFDTLHMGDCTEFSAALYSHEPCFPHLVRDINRKERKLEDIKKTFSEEPDEFLKQEIEDLKNFPTYLPYKMKEQGLTYRDLSFIVSLHDSSSLIENLEGVYDYLRKNPIKGFKA